jgi:FtsZ-binding cell division protein ZapB
MNTMKIDLDVDVKRIGAYAAAFLGVAAVLTLFANSVVRFTNAEDAIKDNKQEIQTTRQILERTNEILDKHEAWQQSVEAREIQQVLFNRCLQGGFDASKCAQIFRPIQTPPAASAPSSSEEKPE